MEGKSSLAHRLEQPSIQSFPVFRTIGEPQKNWLEKLLSIFADVRAGEGFVVVVLTVNLAILLASYYLLKTVREALILTEGGAEVKTYSSAAQAVLLLLLVPAYGAFASRVTRLKLITWVTVFFAVQLIVFYFLGKVGVHEGIIFFIWVGIFNVFVIAQFWAFTNDLFREAQGKRLFPIVGLGGSLGALLGAWAATELITLIGPYALLLTAAAGITACIALTRWADRWSARQPGEQDSSKSHEPLGNEGGFELIFRNRYLLLIAILTVLLNVVNTSGEFLLSKLVVQQSLQIHGAGSEMLRKSFVAEFYAHFFGWVNLLGLLFQMFLVSRIFRHIGVRGSIFILPTIALTGYSLILIYPVLYAVRGLKILENSTDYSIQNTARQALFLPTSREAKYKAKAAVDTFFMRIGDVLTAGIVYVGTKLAFSISAFAAVSVVLTLAWIVVTIGIYREHKKCAPSIA
jgi:AAA family ATP:ADP antiporter